MFQVQLVASGSGETRNYGPKVETLEECTELVRKLDKEFEELCDKDFKGCIAGSAVEIYEGCDIYAAHDDGRMYFVDSDGSGDLEPITWGFVEGTNVR